MELFLVKLSAKEIAKPAQILFNTISRTATYPSKWKTEHQIPIPKIPNPTTEEELRNIAKTPFFSKVYEAFVYAEPSLGLSQTLLRWAVCRTDSSSSIEAAAPLR